MARIAPDACASKENGTSFTSEEANVFLSIVDRVKKDLGNGAVESVPENIIEVLDYLSRFVNDKSAGVKRSKTKFRERRVSSGLILQERVKNDDNTAYEERYKRLTNNDTQYRYEIAKGQFSERYKPTPGLYFVIKPEIEEVKVYDSTAPIDYLFQFKPYFALHILVSIIFSLSGIFAALPLFPLVWMEATGTTDMFLGDETAINGTNQTNATLPSSTLSSGLVTYANVGFIVCCISACIVCLNSVLCINLSALRLQWATTKIRLSCVFVVNLVYTVSAISIFPNTIHIAYMIFRTLAMFVNLSNDAHIAYMKLRFLPKEFEKAVGSSKKNGWLALLVLACFIFVIINDVFRHYVILFATEEHSIISFDIVNPFNGNIFGISNKQVMDATYFTGTVFWAQIVFSTLFHGAHKTTSQTKFIMKS